MMNFLKNAIKMMGHFLTPKSTNFLIKGVLINVVEEGQERLAVMTKENHYRVISFPDHISRKSLDYLIGQTVEYCVEIFFFANVLMGNGFLGSVYFVTKTERIYITILTGVFTGQKFFATVSAKNL